MGDRTAKVGLGPGSLIYVGEHRTDAVSIQAIRYNSAAVEEFSAIAATETRPLLTEDSVTWIDIDGIHDPHLIEEIGEQFGVHFLMLEDIMNSTSRPKVEFGDDYMFLTLKSIESIPGKDELQLEQFSMIVGKNYLITFQEQKGDPFNPVRERIRTAKGVVRSRNTHYLAYLLLDIIVDNYITTSDRYSESIEKLEMAILRRPTDLTLHRILSLRKDLMDFKRSIDPLREMVNAIQKEVDKNIAKYYRDLYDHILSEVENLNMYREMLVTLLDLYHSSLSYKMNSVMKVLTVITTIFVPLTFLVGVYGMNFKYMPELEWKYGYFAVMGIMSIIVLAMLNYFRRRKWL